MTDPRDPDWIIVALLGLIILLTFVATISMEASL